MNHEWTRKRNGFRVRDKGGKSDRRLDKRKRKSNQDFPSLEHETRPFCSGRVTSSLQGKLSDTFTGEGNGEDVKKCAMAVIPLWNLILSPLSSPFLLLIYRMIQKYDRKYKNVNTLSNLCYTIDVNITRGTSLERLDYKNWNECKTRYYENFDRCLYLLSE